jgi:phosphoglycerate kinase
VASRLLGIDDPGVDWSGARVLVRSDLNVPLDDRRVTDDARIRASVPTLEGLAEAGARVAVCSHLGRPKGQRVAELSLRPCAGRLGELMGRRVELLTDCVGPEVRERAGRLAPGELVMLENLRFHEGEEANDPAFAEELAAPFTLYVNDAFGAAHRAHASTEGVAHLLPARAGLLLAREVEVLEGLMAGAEAPFVAVLGGSKVSDKLPLIRRLLERCDRLLIGGAMCFTFLASQGEDVGASLHEDEAGQAIASELMATAVRLNRQLQLPVDVLVADRFAEDAELQVVPSDAIGGGWIGVDIGPRTAASYREVIVSARTVFWNGPMGAFEIPPFADGTRAVAEAMAECPGVTVAGGGDSGAALAQLGLTDRLTHVSTGGGAALELLEGRTLPGVAALPTADRA